MIFITGAMYSGKSAYAMEKYNITDKDWETDCVKEAQELVRNINSEEELKELADKLSKKRLVTASEVGAGVVPVEKEEREFREKAGRLSCMLARESTQAIRMICGIPQVLK
ncbi:MAG: bifunctional adenosylcobinamide kinase/adenosylcobinamide-phosphate guanylyltransferase [Lachnospiraceae bacterium]|nr:bifunctional adenosylcobinamide kinase/adenosylcobinamide-phosphate guanylyltransferase [Lachnospiraceae bacterium]